MKKTATSASSQSRTRSRPRPMITKELDAEIDFLLSQLPRAVAVTDTDSGASAGPYGGPK